MKSMRFLGMTSAAICGAAITLAGTALASGNVAVTSSGPDSNQKVTVDNSIDLNTVNVNVVNVANDNFQQATTGDASANDNTSVGSVGTGDATNKNGTSTVVQINNEPAGSGAQAGNPGPIQGPGGGAAGGSKKPGGSGQVLGAATSQPAILPVTGATVPVDVSALRAAWHAGGAAPAAELAKQTSGLTAGMLIVATLLSLLGGVGSALYGRRSERRV